MASDLPGTWAELRSQHVTGAKLHSAVGRVLVEKCFSEEIANIVNIFQQSIPMLDSELKLVGPEQRRLKLVMDIARSVGYLDIFVSKREEEKRLLFEAALIVLLYFNEELFNIPYLDISSLLLVYPEFSTADTGEIAKLLCFSNFMNCALILLPAKGKKSHLLDLVTRITEGHKQKYVTGGGQTGATSQRVLIYEREGGVTKMQRPPRRTEWSSILEILKDDTHNPHDVPEQVIQNVGRMPTIGGLVSADISTQSSTSFEHSNQPNVFVDTTEVTLTNGGHLVRALSVMHRVSDGDGGTLTSQELMRTVTVSCAVDDENKMDVDRNSFDDFFNEEDLRFLEYSTSNSSGMSFNRSTSSDHGKVYRNVSISKVGAGAVASDFSSGCYIGQGAPGVMHNTHTVKDTGRSIDVIVGISGPPHKTGPPIEAADFENISMSSWPSRDLQQLSELMQCRSLESFSRSNSITNSLQPTTMSGMGDIIINNGFYLSTPSRKSSFTAGDYKYIKDALLPVVTDCDDDDDGSMRN